MYCFHNQDTQKEYNYLDDSSLLTKHLQMLLIKANQNVIDPLILFGEGDLHKSGRYYFVKIHRLTNIKLIFKKMKKNILF